MSMRKMLVITGAVVIATLFATASVAGAVYLGLKSNTTAIGTPVTTDGTAVTNVAPAKGGVNVAGTGASMGSAMAPAYLSGTFEPGGE